MKITITTLSDQLFTVDVNEDLELENFKVLCEVETGVPVLEMAVMWNGRPLHDDKLTLKQYGIKNDDIVLIQHLHGPTRLAGSSQGSATSGNMPKDDVVSLRDMLLKNPAQLAVLKKMNPTLADALQSKDIEKFRKVLNEQRQLRMKKEEDRLRLINADPYDPNSQHMIEEAIRLRNVESNMQSAIEFAPESFGQVHMLYIDCKVNGCPLKALVDSGAQMTIMSQSCAERCHIMRLIDRRWEGLAKGVGTQKILGRIHLCQIQIGSAFLQSSFCILEDQPMDMLLGLDMLRRHQCVIDLKKNQLQIGTTGTATPFLAEADLPDHARLNNSDLTVRNSDRDLAEALSRSARETSQKSSGSKPSASNVSQPSSSAQSQFPEDVVAHLMSYGFSRNVVLEELRNSKGNADQALAFLFSKSFSMP